MCNRCRSEEGFSLIGTKEGSCNCWCEKEEIEIEKGDAQQRIGRCNECGHKVDVAERK